ncbi:MAG: tRNA lysidine(34) synthetase TilS [Bacteroidales bacterium]
MNSHSLISYTQYIISHYSLCSHNDSILVGVSGGIDSMVLCYILHSLGYSIGIAHCNFQLRGEESDADEKFVQSFAHQHTIPFFVHTVDTHKYAHKNGVSLEMAARDIRYDWFNSICKTESYTKIAVAHNANDSIETFFINLFRTTGIKGLTGISIKNDIIIRPLIHTTRKEIELFAQNHSILYRTDSTNKENIFTRNKIRNQLIPLCEEIFPQSIQSILQTINHLNDTKEIYYDSISKEIKKITSTIKDTDVIDKEKLINHRYSQTLLFEILHPYGFNSDTITQLHTALFEQDEQIGKTFNSNKYNAVIDRDFIFIEEIISKQNFSCITIHKSDIVDSKKIETPYGEFIFSILRSSDFSLDKQDCNTASFDYDALEFPLTISTWNAGDSFRPFGMKGNMKISDFLINKKIPVHTKKSILLLKSNKTIIWVTGLRISRDAIITGTTQTILQVRFIPS